MNITRVLFLSAFAASLSLSAGAADPARSADERKAREIYAKIISIPSQLGNAKVPEVAEYLAGEFRAAGFPADDIHIVPFKGDGDQTASLVVRYRSKEGGGNGKRGKPIVVMAHMDVVAAKREDWERDPYTLVEENGYFFGRGTFDDKQGVAALSATFIRLKGEKFVPTRDLIIYFSGDEETAQGSTADVAHNHRELIDAEFALNADAGAGPLDDNGKALFFSYQTAEKTYADFTLTARNPGGHSSLPRPDNAIYELADALVKVRAYKFPVMWNDTTVAFFKGSGLAHKDALGAALTKYAANPGDADAVSVIEKEPSMVGSLRTTCVATMLSGGHAENALPQRATANVNCRIFPGVKPDDVLATLQGVVGRDIDVKYKGTPQYSDASPLRADVDKAVTRAVHMIHPGIPVFPFQEPGATDGLVFRSIGIPTYGVDANFMPPKETFTHGLNERLLVKSFYDSLTFWHALLTDLAGQRR
jgi:acetylornithine deacetylase/succinyl-diaminopimelate desuccinylase-like protein